MHSIPHAILEMEQKASQGLHAIQREKDKLPARIEAEVSHINDVISREMEQALLTLKIELKKSTEERIIEIQEENARLLEDLQIDFDKNRADIRTQLFKRAISWMP